MGKLVNKLYNKMAKMGVIDLQSAPEKADDLEFVKEVIKRKGAAQFQYASDYIKSDANSLLDLVGIDPEILDYKSEVVFDRYVDNDNLCVNETEEVDPVIFALKCVLKNNLSLCLFNKEIQNKVISIIHTNQTVEGKFNGKPFTFKALEHIKELELIDITIEFTENGWLF